MIKKHPPFQLARPSVAAQSFCWWIPVRLLLGPISQQKPADFARSFKPSAATAARHSSHLNPFLTQATLEPITFPSAAQMSRRPIIKPVPEV
jgi:hypothetical protein